MEKMVITIARSYGSGGRTLGKKLAKEYGMTQSAVKSSLFRTREKLRLYLDKEGIEF